MNASLAMEIVDRLTFTVQRMRSLHFERQGSDAAAQRFLIDLTPYVHGPKCLLTALTKIQDRGSVTPGELYNLCFIAHSLEPTIALNASLSAIASGQPDLELPSPSAAWLSQPWA